MLASAANSISGFVSRRRRGLTWTVGTVGGVYMLGKWGFQKMQESAETARRERLENDNLSKRFQLNLQDCQFTVLALLPVLAKEVFESMDVEASTAALARIAAQAKEEQARVERELAAEREAAETRVDVSKEVEEAGEIEDEEAEKPKVVGEGEMPSPVAIATEGANAGEEVGEHGDKPASEVGEEAAPSFAEVVANGESAPTTTTKEVHSDGQETPLYAAVAATTIDVESDPQVPFTNGHSDNHYTASDSTAEPVSAVDVAGSDSAPPALDASTATLSRSWAEVVSTENGAEAAEVEPPAPKAPAEPAEQPKPEPTRAELWNDIKILSFTRAITSLYLLSLVSLKTHVQLNLLGRGAYVASVLSSVPRTSMDDLPLTYETNDDRDLERAFEPSGAKLEMVDYSSGTPESQQDVETKYLTYSWWLLNKGWKIVAERVKDAVEEVVGPMALKSTLVYGELGSLFAQIRQRVDFDSPGKPFSFLPALFPLNMADEHLTLSAGGIPSSFLSISPALRTLLNETHDFLESSDCNLVHSRVLDALFSHLVVSLEGPFRSTGGASEHVSGSRFEDVTERQAKLAGLLPALANASHLVMKSVPNTFLEAMEDVPELREFSAIIFSSFDKDNLRGI